VAPVTIIEATAKRYKGMQASGCAVIVLGFIVAIAGGGGWGGLLLLGGLVLYGVGRYNAWWHHR
jgi:hypothetical protein